MRGAARGGRGEQGSGCMRQFSRPWRYVHQRSLLQAASCGLGRCQSPASFKVPRLLAIIRRLGRCLQHLLVLLRHRQAGSLGLSAADCCAQWGISGRHWWCCCCGPAVWLNCFGRHGVVVGFLSCLPRARPAAVESFSKLADSIYFKHMPDVGPSAAHSSSTTSSSDSASSASTSAVGSAVEGGAAAAAAGSDASRAAAGTGAGATDAQDSVARPLASQDDSAAASQGDGPLPELWVNQLVSSSVRWRDLRLVARQEAGGQRQTRLSFMAHCCGCWAARGSGSCGQLLARRREGVGHCKGQSPAGN